MAKFTIGCDPEFFVKNDKGVLVTAAGLIPGDKETPHPVPGGAIQVDGMAVEFNTDPVASGDHISFHDNFTRVVAALKDKLPKGYSLVIEPSVEFDKEYYDTVVPADAKKLGCDPDYNAYTGEKNVPPSSDSPLRGAAGHIHIGWGQGIPAMHPDHFTLCREFVKCLDFWVGVGLTIFETDTVRRTMYGASGAFRPKSYGVEYRVPSNAWCQSKGRRQLMLHLVNSAINDMSRPIPYYRYWADRYRGTMTWAEDVRRIIDTSDREAAWNHITHFGFDTAGNRRMLIKG